MDNKFIALAVGLTVGVIMLSGFLWPVVADATATETTFKNDGYYRMTEITDETSGEWVYSWTKEEPAIIYVNDVAYNMDVPTGLSYSIIGASDGWVSRYVNTATPYIQTMFSDGVGSGGNGLKSFDCTISGGTAEFSLVLSDDTIATKTMAYTTCYVLDKNGSWIMKDKNKPAYMNADSEFFAIGVTASAGFPLNVFKITGNIEDGATVTNPIHKYNGNDFVASNVVVHSSEVNGYLDLYSLDKFTFTATDGTDTINATYSYFLVPYEVTAEKSWHLDTTQIALVAAIGTLGAIVLIAAAAGSIRRLD